MSSVALPSQLVSPPRISGDDRLKSENVVLYPANASGATSFSYTNNSRIVFNIPSYPKSFVNPSRSYLSFTIKKTGTSASSTRICNNCPFISRFTLKAGSQLIEDIQDYATLEKAMSLFEGVDFTETRSHVNGDFSDLTRKLDDTKLSDTITRFTTDQETGKTYTKPLLSGVIGKGQEYYLPVGLFQASSSHALQMEIHLAPDDQVVQSLTGDTSTASYTISNVGLHLEVVQLPERAIGAFNEAVMSGGMVSIPFKTSRVFRQYVPTTQTSIDMNIVESAKNVENAILVIRDQSSLTGHYASTDFKHTNDNLEFLGGSETNTVVSQISWRYGTQQYPPSPIENIGGTLPIILNNLSSMDMLNKAVRMTTIDTDAHPIYDTNSFAIVQGFKTSADNIENGLNAAASGAPLELKLRFSENTNNLALFCFVNSSYSLNVKAGGNVTMVDGRVV